MTKAQSRRAWTEAADWMRQMVSPVAQDVRVFGGGGRACQADVTMLLQGGARSSVH